MKSLYVACLAIVLILYCEPSLTYELKKIFENVPSEDLEDFFQFYLRTIKEYPTQKIVDEKTHETILTKWLVQKYGTTRNKRSTYGTEICFPNGQCIDIGDSGIYP